MNYSHEMKLEQVRNTFGTTQTRSTSESAQLRNPPHPAPERARPGAELQELQVAGKFDELLPASVPACPKMLRHFITEQEKSDVVHDLLAFMAERVLEMNKQKQQEIKGFLGWLEGYVGAKVEDLTPKTKLQGYYEHDYEDFLAVLRKNKKLLAIDPAAGSRARRFGPSTRALWASCCLCGSGSRRRMS
jgi:hypothetical protein